MLEEILDTLLGLEAENLNIVQMAMRAVVVYLAALVMVRLGEKRFLGKSTAFDVILGIILGSVVSRAITGGSYAFFPTLGAGFVLVLLHWLLAALAFRSDRFGDVVKGGTRQLIRDGEIQWEQMGKSHISKTDLIGALRSEARISDPSEAKEAYLERSGQVSVIKRESEPRILEVRVEEGVQTIRIQLE